ncbi:DEAD/DEAH box helicase [Brevundimonas balnearis]|uniref:DEAD/DEAH box helicase n=1 Tax=Brevundimonas balnearis TaxID=1572858 RepID=A0ABV6R2L5_9CAUL
MAGVSLRRWQSEALEVWEQNRRKGIVGAVTGGGKTVFALSAIARAKLETTLIVVPTVALLDQWWDETAAFFNVRLDDINVIRGKPRIRAGTINLAVMNTATKIPPVSSHLFLVVDECHKAASPKLRAVLDLPKHAALGLSATPERPYDEGLEEVLVPALGPVLYRYTYREALADGVIVPFYLRNVVFELEPESQAEYDKLTRAIARTIDRFGPEAPESVALMLRRARVLNLSMARVRLTLRLVARHRGQRILIFHESVEACILIHAVLIENGVKAGIYHSKMGMRERADMLTAYRAGEIEVLVTCRALDEGFNVPETEIGIIAASTATRRQRIQRLGRVLRPAAGKDGATIYTLVATKPEIDRLRAEEIELEGVAEASWVRA